MNNVRQLLRYSAEVSVIVFFFFMIGLGGMLIYDNRDQCDSKDGCLIEARKHMAHFQSLEFRDETKAEREESKYHAQMAVKYFKEVQKFGGDPGEELLTAQDTLSGYELAEFDNLRKVEGKVDAITKSLSNWANRASRFTTNKNSKH
jgi:hypothetical protein